MKKFIIILIVILFLINIPIVKYPKVFSEKLCTGSLPCVTESYAKEYGHKSILQYIIQRLAL